ncbi:hypothetical protein [Nocardioides sp. YIM 152315]|uniref:hypothetical protein n=1 Tax=Nocardioides sp. YIM 152315 TaxID=3031760 RepID=UPI0023DBB440|nr:hypothetical protein [Nocardioides sp. YIM 152315]MDF1603880.1 hypothetical protein [Nocardioides sp. YIM 152315]
MTGLLAPLLALTLAGCGDSSSPRATEPSEEPAPSSQPPTESAAPPIDELCPARLALPADPDAPGSGTSGDADEAPSLPTPEQAWTCRYDPVDAGQRPEGGPGYAWVRHGEPRVVGDADLDDLAEALAHLAPFDDAGRMCTTDLGPRWLVVYPHDDGLVGVVVDDFGCRDVRLTDDPAETPPGAAEGDGLVRGALDGGAAVLAAVGVGRSS